LRVILSSIDFRRSAFPPKFVHSRAWAPELYAQLRAELAQLR
jgi:hypothetical protein